MADYTKPESRFRMPSAFDFIGRKMGETLLSDTTVATESDQYILASRYKDNPMINIAENQLTQSLFKIPQDITQIDDRVFDINREDDRDVFNISSSEYGKEYQAWLDDAFKRKISMHDASYKQHLKNKDNQAAQNYLTAAREELMSKNPDTGEMSFKFREGVLGDVYLNPKGEFSDYWNIGLDKNEKITSMTNLKRKFAAPFTKPPTIRGNINLDESTRSFYELLFSDPSAPIETKIIDDMKDKSIFQDNEIYNKEL